MSATVDFSSVYCGSWMKVAASVIRASIRAWAVAVIFIASSGVGVVLLVVVLVVGGGLAEAV